VDLPPWSPREGLRGAAQGPPRPQHLQFNVDGLELGSIRVRSYAFGVVVQEVESRLLPVLTAVADVGAVVDLQACFATLRL
jgi:hypothetical protein